MGEMGTETRADVGLLSRHCLLPQRLQGSGKGAAPTAAHASRSVQTSSQSQGAPGNKEKATDDNDVPFLLPILMFLPAKGTVGLGGHMLLVRNTAWYNAPIHRDMLWH